MGRKFESLLVGGQPYLGINLAYKQAVIEGLIDSSKYSEADFVDLCLSLRNFAIFDELDTIRIPSGLAEAFNLGVALVAKEGMFGRAAVCNETDLHALMKIEKAISEMGKNRRGLGVLKRFENARRNQWWR